MTAFITHAQTFFTDPSLVKGASQVQVTSVVLYCKKRPSAINNISGIPNPGISVSIVPMINGAPSSMPVPTSQVARVPYGSIIPSIDASTTTTARFTSPISISTGTTYAIIIVADGNEEFEFWTATVGEQNIATKQTVSSLSFNGALYQLPKGSTTWAPLAGAELKFDVFIARYYANGTPVTNSTAAISYVLDNYEYVDYDGLTSTDQMIGGENVFMTKGSYDGNCSVTQGNTTVVSNTLFTTWYSNNDVQMIVVDGGSVVNVRKVLSINGYQGVVDTPFSFTNAQAKFYSSVPTANMYIRILSENAPVKRSLILSESTANTINPFANGCTIRGATSNSLLVNCIFQNMVIASVDIEGNISVPSGTSFSTTETFGYTTLDGGATFSNSVDTFPITMGVDTVVPGGPVTLVSRSNETVWGNVHVFDSSNSSVVNINLSSTFDFTSPTLVDRYSIPAFYTRYYINNDYTNENTPYGNATSKEITKTINLAPNQYAEDILSWLIAYRPIGTDFKVLAKMYNTVDPDAFEDKDWTLLKSANGSSTTYSSSTDKTDLNEYAYDLPSCPNSDFTYTGFVTLNSGETNVTATSTMFAANVAVGDLVKIYSPLFPNTNFMVASVTLITNSSVIVIDQSTTNSSIWGTGLMLDHIGYPYQAFKNNQNSNIVRYYDSTRAYHDTYNQFAIKVVFLSNSLSTIPFYSSMRAVAVSS